MPLDQGLLKGAQSREWVVAKPPPGATPQWVYTGRDESGLGPIYVALASVSAPPSRETMRALHTAYKGKSNIQLVIGAVLENQIWIFGPDEKTAITEPLALDQGCRQLNSALDEPDAIAAYTRLGQFRRSLDTTSLVGIINSGLFASYHIRENVPKRSDWQAACEKSKQILSLRNEQLIKALGFKSEKTAGNALLLTTGTPQSKAVAILLDETEQFDATSARHTGISPVAFGLNVAVRQGVPWLFVLRKDQIRIYPAKDGVGVGQKGQVETYLEIDLAAIDSERAGLLTLIFSAEALEPNGTAQDLLQGSQLFASRLGSRLRERIYEQVVPHLSKSVAEHLRDSGTQLDSEGLNLAYRLTLKILFRLLFQAYAEDRGLLPAGRNEGYDANSLKTIAKRIINIPEEQFGKSKTLWLDLVQVWDAIDEGNETWNVPAYNGGLFGKDPISHPEGALIEKLGIQDDVLGPALQHLLLDISEDDILGPVDFRSLSVREFGTIYEGLLESSLSVATQNLTTDAKGAWIPAASEDQIFVSEGEVYFHSASGERKSTGSYFTPSVVVDHLLSRSLDPALDIHLAKIKAHLDAGDDASAARDFFDFRVVDLAMGSGHFLVAAVDRIEAKMRFFLSEKETQVPGINAELSRLKQAAKKALAKDESVLGEIEPAALLRRQIARRCIYGLDINPLAVELSRLAIWIHTFVPGLPMSSLNHGLICGNSISGIGTVDEAVNALNPELKNVKSNPNDGHQATVFENVIFESLDKSKHILKEVLALDEATKAEVKAITQASQKAISDAAPALEVFQLAAAARLGLVDPRRIFSQDDIAKNLNNSTVESKLDDLNPAHLPYLFPEVFIRENPGFDVLIGNPPWEKMHVKEDVWWALRFPGIMSMQTAPRSREIDRLRKLRPDLVGELEREKEAQTTLKKFVETGLFTGIGSSHLDLFACFAWRNWQLCRQNGSIALVLPRGAFSGSSLADWRMEIIRDGTFGGVSFLINSGEWVFSGVHGQYTFGLSVIEKKDSDVISFNGPFTSEDEFLSKGSIYSTVQKRDFLSWSNTAAFPSIPDEKSIQIFLQMRNSPAFRGHKSFEYQPVQGDINVTNVREFVSEVQNSKATMPVLMGAAFNLWDPYFGEPFGYLKQEYISEMVSKAKRATRNSKSAFRGLTIKDQTDLPFSKARIGFRLITNPTNTRTGIFCLLPPNTICGHGAPYLHRRSGDAKTDAFLLAVLSSIPFDWYVRRWVELNFTFELLAPMPIPEYDKDDPLSLKLVELVFQLVSADDKFAEWIHELDLDLPRRALGIEEKNFVLAQIDGVVALLYGLSATQTAHLFSTFHKGWNYGDRLDLVLEAMEVFKR